MSDPYPPPAFAFGVNLRNGPDAEAAGFSEVSGLTPARDAAAVVEGGENRFVHRLPGRIGHANLVLKRGMLPAGAPLFGWCRDTLQGDLSGTVAPRDLAVTLFDGTGAPLIVWNVVAAWPVRWSIAGRGATGNDIAVETLEFAYTRLEREPG
jgi:phage tail-like protein